MTDSDTLHNRGRALENAFFSNLDEKLITELRQREAAAATIEELRASTGIQDQKVLEAMSKLGAKASTVVALRLFPLVAVAWADGSVDASEAEAINGFAAKHLANAPLASEVLQNWLSKKPASEMIDAWETYAHAIVSSMTAESAATLKSTLVKELNEVASASGGVFGWGAVSKSEHDVVKRITEALTN